MSREMQFGATLATQFRWPWLPNNALLIMTFMTWPGCHRTAGTKSSLTSAKSLTRRLRAAGAKCETAGPTRRAGE